MGGAMDIVSSALNLVTDFGKTKKPSMETSGQYELLREEREAQEEEQRQQEAEERKREREKTTEAREIERKRLAVASKGQTTLANGGAGLLVEPEVETPRLKATFGE